jgi:predicted solute-binding protein
LSAPELRGSLRLGCVKYLNARPLIYGWRGEVRFDHPAALCELLAAGLLDVALVSSFEYLRHPVYSIVDGISIASDGPVYSVVVAYRGAIEDLTEITIDPASKTSVNLLGGLLRERGLKPRLVSESASSNRDDARLLIGDQAIKFRERHRDLNFWDLGEEWQRHCQRPFVYALWLIRPECSLAKEIADRLRALRNRNLERIEEVIASQDQFDRHFCERYYRDNLRFKFGRRESEGLCMFQTLCAKHGLLPRPDLHLTLV